MGERGGRTGSEYSCCRRYCKQLCRIVFCRRRWRVIRRNEQYDEAIQSIREMMQEEKYSEAHNMCLNLLTGNLKYRCVNAEFWKLYASAEKEQIRSAL